MGFFLNPDAENRDYFGPTREHRMRIREHPRVIQRHQQRASCEALPVRAVARPADSTVSPSQMLGVQATPSPRAAQCRFHERGELSTAAPIGLGTSTSVRLRHIRGRPPRGPRPAFVLRRNSTAARQETRFARKARLSDRLGRPARRLIRDGLAFRALQDRLRERRDVCRALKAGAGRQQRGGGGTRSPGILQRVLSPLNRAVGR